MNAAPNVASTAAPPLAVAHLTALDRAPLPWVRHAARAGFDALGLRMHAAAPGAIAYPVPAGTAAHRELQQVLQGEGMRVHDVEFVPVVPGLKIDRCTAARLAGARSTT